MKPNLMMAAVVMVAALMAGACGGNGPKNLQEAGATADAGLATAGPAMSTAGAQAGDAAATAAAAGRPAVATMGAVAGEAAGTVESKLNDRLVARVWQWQETTGDKGGSTKPANPAAYTVALVPGGAVAIKADCKTAAGSFTADDTALRFTVKVSTVEPCPAGSMADAFVEQLGRVASWSADGKNLTLTLDENAGTMRFVAQ